MTAGGYSLSINAVQRFVHTNLRGHWSIDLVDTFEMDVRRQLAEHRLTPETSVCLSESLDYSLPSQDVAKRLGAMFRWRRRAIVSMSQLTRVQVNRVFAGQETRVFDTVEAARAWLFENA